MQTTKLKFDPEFAGDQGVSERTRAPVCARGHDGGVSYVPAGHDHADYRSTRAASRRSTSMPMDMSTVERADGRPTFLERRFIDLTGIVLDAGIVAGATSTVAVCCGPSGGTIAFVNGPQGGRAVAVPHIRSCDEIGSRSGGLKPASLQDLGECVPGEAVVHAVAAPCGKYRRWCHDASPVHHRCGVGTDCRRGRGAGSRSSRRWIAAESSDKMMERDSGASILLPASIRRGAG